MAKPKPAGRREPYTEAGIRRCKCQRCGQPAHAQWSICANGNRQVPICLACDIELNRAVLIFMGFDRVDERMDAYVRKVLRKEARPCNTD